MYAGIMPCVFIHAWRFRLIWFALQLACLLFPLRGHERTGPARFFFGALAASPLLPVVPHTCSPKLAVSHELEVCKGGHSLFAFRNPECGQYLVNFHLLYKFLILWRSTNGLNLPPNSLTSSVFNHQEKHLNLELTRNRLSYLQNICIRNCLPRVLCKGKR